MLLGSPRGRHYLYKTVTFFSLRTLSGVQNGVFQRKERPVIFIKPDIREICKPGKIMPLFSLSFFSLFVLEDIFVIKIVFMYFQILFQFLP